MRENNNIAFSYRISDDELKICYRILDPDGTEKVLFGDLHNYLTVEDINIRLILMKLRIEAKLFLSHRDRYPYILN